MKPHNLLAKYDSSQFPRLTLRVPELTEKRNIYTNNK
jgi:hypothetical protein